VFTAIAATGLRMTLSALFLYFSPASPPLCRVLKIFFNWGPNLLLAALAVVPLIGDDDNDDLQIHKNDLGTLYTIPQFMCCI